MQCQSYSPPVHKFTTHVKIATSACTMSAVLDSSTKNGDINREAGIKEFSLLAGPIVA